MKLNHLILVADAVERISNLTETDNIPAIVDALVGIAWDKEDAKQIKAYSRSEDCAEWILRANRKVRANRKDQPPAPKTTKQ